MTSQSSCHVSSRIQHCDNNKTTDGQRLSRDPSENCGRKAPSGIKSNSATTTMPQQQQPCEMWMTKNGFMMKCMDQNNSRRTLMITYHLPLHTLSFAIYSCCHRGHFPTILNNTLSTSYNLGSTAIFESWIRISITLKERNDDYTIHISWNAFR